MVYPMEYKSEAKIELANRLFSRPYRCANMLHKAGTRAVEAEGLTTPPWAVLGALSRGWSATDMWIGRGSGLPTMRNTPEPRFG